MNYTLHRCYDSHLHLMATGMVRAGLDLRGLTQARQLGDFSLRTEYFRGDWLVGFGWDQNLFPEKKYPKARDLDFLSHDMPVALSRADGHALWVNSKAIQLMRSHPIFEKINDGSLANQIGFDENGEFNGIFFDNAKHLFESLIPPYEKPQQKSFLRCAIDLLNQRGFTHARDMSCTQIQYDLLSEFDQNRELTLYLDLNFTCDKPSDFDKVLSEVKYAKQHPSPHLRVPGIKIYLDGALGSQGASLTEKYPGTNSQGFLLWSESELKEVMQKTWENKLSISVHALGDLASLNVVNCANDLLKTGLDGEIHLEHCQVMSHSAIQKLKGRQAVCHMQPCHWLSDKAWLEKKLGKLYQSVFPWAAIHENGIGIQFGSDSPIESPSVWNNLIALQDSAMHGIPSLNLDSALQMHQHADSNWGSNCMTHFSKDQILKVIFDGQPLGLSSKIKASE